MNTGDIGLFKGGFIGKYSRLTYRTIYRIFIKTRLNSTIDPLHDLIKLLRGLVDAQEESHPKYKYQRQD